MTAGSSKQPLQAGEFMCGSPSGSLHGPGPSRAAAPLHLSAAAMPDVEQKRKSNKAQNSCVTTVEASFAADTLEVPALCCVWCSCWSRDRLLPHAFEAMWRSTRCLALCGTLLHCGISLAKGRILTSFLFSLEGNVLLMALLAIVHTAAFRVHGVSPRAAAAALSLPRAPLPAPTGSTLESVSHLEEHRSGMFCLCAAAARFQQPERHCEHFRMPRTCNAQVLERQLLWISLSPPLLRSELISLHQRTTEEHQSQRSKLSGTRRHQYKRFR